MASDRSDHRSLSLEHQILLCAARPVLTAERSRRLGGLLDSSVNWSLLVAHAHRHGLVPLLYRQVRAVSPPHIPSEAMAALEAQARASMAWNLRLSHELSRLLVLFNGSDIPVMPLKGLYVNSLLYGESLCRPTSDLDLLIKPQHLPSCERILLAEGYRRQPMHLQGAEYHVSYVTEDQSKGDVVVELHVGLGENYVSGLDVATVWNSASPCVWESRTIWAMALPDLFLYLCLHAVKDGLASVRSLLDITLLLEQFGQTLPWHDLERRIADARIRIPVHCCLGQCRKLLNAPVPEQFLSAIRPRLALGWLCGQALFHWRGEVLGVSSTLLTGPVMALQMLLWEESAIGKVRHIRRNLFPSPQLRARWLSRPDVSPFRWYIAWLWTAARQFFHQLLGRLHSRFTSSP